MRPSLFLLCLSLGHTANAQPPVSVNWSAILPFGSGNTSPGGRIDIDQDTVAWMVMDSAWAWTSSDGVVWRYLSDGTAITGSSPDRSIGCGSSDMYVDFRLRNDSLWGISAWQYTAAPLITYCANSPSGNFTQDPYENGEDLTDGALDLLVGGNAWYICAWHDTAPGLRDARIVALDLANTVLWQVDLPEADFGSPHALALRGDTLVLGAFPALHWLSASSGAYLGSAQLYNGPPGAGRVHWDGATLLWAAHANGTLHFGRLDGLAVPLFSGALAGGTVNAITKDAQDRMWIGGASGNAGSLTRIAANGAVDGIWTFGASVTDMDFANGSLFWTGRLVPNAPDSYLISGTPNP